MRLRTWHVKSVVEVPEPEEMVVVKEGARRVWVSERHSLAQVVVVLTTTKTNAIGVTLCVRARVCVYMCVCVCVCDSVGVGVLVGVYLPAMCVNCNPLDLSTSRPLDLSPSLFLFSCHQGCTSPGFCAQYFRHVQRGAC